MRNTTLATYTRFAALVTAVAVACMGTGYAGGWQHDQEQLAQMAELHNLHATFHAAVSVHDPVNGDTAAEITQRIKDALSVWADDAVLTVEGSTATAGNYVGNGDPDDPQRAQYPRAIPLPGVNRARCAHSLSMSPEGYSRRTSLSRFPLNIKRSLSLCMKTGSGNHQCILSATTSMCP